MPDFTAAEIAEAIVEPRVGDVWNWSSRNINRTVKQVGVGASENWVKYENDGSLFSESIGFWRWICRYPGATLIERGPKE